MKMFRDSHYPQPISVCVCLPLYYTFKTVWCWNSGKYYRTSSTKLQNIHEEDKNDYGNNNNSNDIDDNHNNNDNNNDDNHDNHNGLTKTTKKGRRIFDRQNLYVNVQG